MSSSLDNVPFGSIPYSQHHLIRNTPFGSVNRQSALAMAIPNVGAISASRTRAVIRNYTNQTTFAVTSTNNFILLDDFLSGGVVVLTGTPVNVVIVGGTAPTWNDFKESFRRKFNRYPKSGDAFIVYLANNTLLPATLTVGLGLSSPLTLSPGQVSQALVYVTKNNELNVVPMNGKDL